jgi:phage/plasmid-like protein (TIGR03299 family)
MAHDIDRSTGGPAIAYVGRKPWHGLGEKLTEGVPIEEWLKAARLGWRLKRLPVQYLADGGLQTMDDRFVLVRSDTHAGLSIVSGDYQIVQPSEVLEFYRELITLYGYTLETSGALDGGRKIWALARTGVTCFVDKGREDQLAAYILLATSCDKTLATTAAFTSIRVVCDNTLFFAMEDIKSARRPQVKVPHNLRFDPQSVKDELGLMDKPWSGFIAKVGEMAGHPMKPDAASSFFVDLLAQKQGKPLSSKARREHEAIIALFGSAPGQDLSSAKETLWGAVNAVTYYVDHVRSGSAGDRLDSAWFGSGYALKEKAWVQASGLLPKS